MDALKEAIADGVYSSISPTDITVRLSNTPASAVEVTRTETLTTLIRVSTDHGPRYFQVKVSEML